jgi:FKBP-type peptidyl-prolyl cis-trans isomerase 2
MVHETLFCCFAGSWSKEFLIGEGMDLPTVLACTVVEVDGENVHLDFNTPLSGHTVILDVELLELIKAIPHPIFQNHHCVRVGWQGEPEL